MHRLFKNGDKINNIAGSLEFLGYSKKSKSIWKCFCGKIFETMSYDVKNHKTKSCGCWKEKQIIDVLKDPNIIYLKCIWRNIKSRCCNKNNPAYHNYGARGITICSKWKNNCDKFIEDIIKNLGHRPNSNYELDRIKVNKNYELNNLRWASPKESGRNRRNNHLISINGEMKTISEWGEIFNLNISTIYRRIEMGWVGIDLLKPTIYRSYSNKKNYLQKIWHNIKKRCFDKKSNSYKYYGGRGIIIYPEWKSNYKLFEDYIINNLGHRPAGRHYLDRIDNDKNYEPGNLRWLKLKESARNKSSNKLIAILGVTKTLVEWAEDYNINITTLCKRIKNNWPEEKLLKPVFKRRFSQIEADKIKSENKSLSVNELTKKYNVSESVIKDIIRNRGAYKK